MKRILPGMAALASALAVPALAQQSLVNFSAAGSDLAHGTSATHDVASTFEKRWNFDLTSPLFASYYPIYGGARVTNTSGLINGPATYMKMSTTSTAWPNAPKLFLFSSSDSSTVANNVDAAFLWKRADFINTGTRVVFESNASLSVNITDWYGTSAVPGQVRFVVKNGDTYYVSEASRGGTGTLSLTDFNNNGTAGKRWAVIAPSGNTLALPASGLTFAAVNFDDVQAVGVIGRGSRAYSTLYSFNTFQATGTVTENSMILSTNLAHLNDYVRVPVFLDVTKNLSAWFSTQTPSGAWSTNQTVTLDSDGWPTGVPILDTNGGQHSAITIIRNLMIAGQYSIRFKGTGRFDVNVRGGGWDYFDSARIAGLPVDSKGYRYATLKSVSISDPADGGNLWLIIRESTDNPGTSARENLHDFQIVQPGFTFQQAKQQIFNPDYVSQTSMYNTIRYMDWGLTNGHWASEWSQRTKPTWYTQGQGRGVAIEYMVAFSNATGANMWYCVPHKASDDYVTKAAKVIRHGAKADGEPFDPAVDPVSARVWPGLNPNLKLYLEYSNETWNEHPSFSQSTYVDDQGVLLRDTQGLPMGTDTDLAGDRYAAYRSAQIWQKFYDVFGTEAPNRVVRVIGSAIGSGVVKNRLEAFSVPGLITNGQYPDALATAPYFGGGVVNDIVNAGLAATITIPEILDRVQTAVNNLGGNVRETRDLAKLHRVRFINYEGGQHIVGHTGAEYNNDMKPKVVSANRDPRMKTIYESYLATLNANGVSEHTHFNDIQPWSGQSGCWGAQEYFGQPLSAAGKTAALVDFIQNNPRTNQPPLARYTASNFIDTDGNGSQAVSLDASLSRDLETSIAEYTWRIGTTRVTGSTLSVTLPIGDHTGTLTVVDTEGAVSVTPLSFSVLPANSDVTVYRSNFTGTAPALNTPWTQTSVLNTGLTQSGWTWGVRPNSSSNGITGGVNVNNKFCVNMRGPSSGFTTLAEALTTNSYLTLTLTPAAGKVLDLRGATLQFELELSISAARRFALMTSVGGFSEAAALYVSPETMPTGLRSFTVRVPATAAYNNLTGPVEIRLYMYENQYLDKGISLTGFEVKSAVR